MLHDVTLDRSLHMRIESAAKIKTKRLQNSVLLRVRSIIPQKLNFLPRRLYFVTIFQNVVREIQTQWIKEWCCLFLGRPCNEELERLIDSRLKLAIEQLYVLCSIAIYFHWTVFFKLIFIVEKLKLPLIIIVYSCKLRMDVLTWVKRTLTLLYHKLLAIWALKNHSSTAFMKLKKRI